MSLRSIKSTRELISQLSSGVGSSKLPSSITKISLTYAFKGKNESAGAKHFLHETLPRMQYNNPSVLFELNKSADPTTKPVVTVHFGEKSSTIDIPRLHSDTICEKVMDAKP
ncbi:uncharacterized protein BX664DRAFT_340741 [Halteromyces radiatus]|uniref:uncharacterized protein n=1 Tax=Halteromyces radiatus TaxID=101107 RepID=UPI00221FF137|nr:uncharacterized protein BX664DRAFT_340741 [Halteromyces radiatus]KAI8081573.1 hypothetical protein BX664DRAFT_340741 [Halteromyces radiatus]